MAKLRMKKIELIAMLTDSKKIMELLQRRGVVEICGNSDEELENTNVSAVVGEFDKFRNTVLQALEILEKYSPEKAGLSDMLNGKTEVEKHTFGQRATELEKIMNTANEIIRSSKAVEDSYSKIAQNEIRCDTLKPWRKLDLPMNFKGTDTTLAVIGSLPYMTDSSELESELPEGCSAEVIYSAKSVTHLFILCNREVYDEATDILRKKLFVPISDPESSTPTELIKSLSEENIQLKKQAEQLEKHIAELAEYRKSLKFTVDYLKMRQDKYNALNSLGFTESTFILTGYIPEKYADGLIKEIESKFTVSVELSDPSDDDDVPVLLENGGFSSPVEPITKMYAMPSKSDVDPTPVMSFFYYLFFGMMLSDAGYGLVMLIATSVILAKCRLEDSMKKTMTMFRNCAVSTVIWGALFGSWFGDIVQVVGREFFNKEIGSLALWFEPINDPVKLLLFSFGLGILHLFLGVAVSFKMSWDEGRKLDAVLDTVPVYLTVLGVAPLGASILADVPETFKTVGSYMAIAGVVLLLLTAGRSSKSVFGKIFGGIYALYNTATGYLSDILSYSRLLALGLATGSIAGVINLIGTMPENTAVKAILLTAVFIVGHTANIAINLLGAYVHTDRLQFVELFSKFYTGGGREFSPFKADTQYIRFREKD